MPDSEQEGNLLLAEADKKLRTVQGVFGSLFGNGSSKVDEALALYRRAANKFKLAKKWEAAAKAFCKAASLNAKIGMRHDAALNYHDAANCYKKVLPAEAVVCLQKAVDIYVDMGRFNLAAKHQQAIAEVYDKDIKDSVKASEFYEQAADLFKSEASNACANKCLLKVAAYAAGRKDYVKAIRIYEEIGSSALDSNLLKYSAKDHFFRSALCHLCVDPLNAQNAIARYEDQYPAFTVSRECSLLKSLCQAVEEEDLDGFRAALSKFQSISPLEQWHKALILRVQNTISEYPDLR